MQRRHSLKKSAEFQRVRALKKSWAHPLLVLYAARSDLDVVRVGISVGKRVGKAVARNRIKRLIREAMRAHLAGLPHGNDLVFIARPPISEAAYAQVRGAVENLLVRSGLLPRRGRTPGEQEGARPARPSDLAARPPMEPVNHEMDSSASD